MDIELQNANFWKRASAFLLDFIFLTILITGFAWAISAVTGFDDARAALDAHYADYAQRYGISFDLTQEEYAALTEEELKTYDAAFEAMNKDDAVIRDYSLVINLTLTVTSLSILLAMAVLELAVPLWLKNGQTIGKKIFGICLVRPDCVRVTPPLMVIRTFLGKYTLETMVPLLIIMMIAFGSLGLPGTLVLMGIAVVQVVVFFKTRTNSVIHDLLAKTVAVDMASQTIFDSEEELLEYKQKRHAEMVERQTY